MRSRDSPAVAPPSRLAPAGKIDAVGLDHDLQTTMDRLCGNAGKLQILPIAGTGGIGKTTLARNVYHDSLIIGEFQIRGWVTVSQDYRKGDIFASLLASMKDFIREETSGLSSQEMAEKVYATLFGRKYLLVIDDMWSTKTWDEVRYYFPDDGRSGSRIMLTTRLEDVATYVDSTKPFHEMQYLDNDQSLNLLKKELCKGECRLPMLEPMEMIASEIAKSCGGLPLALVVTAGLLSEVDATEADWEQISANINLAVAADEDKYVAILSSSYTHLPRHLRNCFLYIGAFPEDYEIRVSKLVKLWVAEGFVTETKSPEERAEEFLEDLVKRNLVLVTKRKSNGGIKGCGLHDLVRDLCLIKSLEENFFLSFMGSLFLSKIFKNQLRISISNSDILANIDGSTVCTIMCYSHSSVDSLERFRLLKILDMVNNSVPAQVFEMTDLTFLAYTYTPMVVPESASNFKNLQTLIIYPNSNLAKLVDLPVKIWKMRRLRHLISSSFNALPHPDVGDPPLEKLQTLSLATNFVCSERMVGMIPNVKKLGICYSQEKLDEDYHLENLERLVRLEKLKLEIHCDFRSLSPVFPKSLKKLTLSGGRRPWEELSIVGSLPNLQVLKLKNYACDGSSWETTEFKMLQFLLIDESNLEEMSTESSHFPRLRRLLLHRCLSLQEIPDEIGDFPSLELIEIVGSNQSLAESAKKIQTDQEEQYGNCNIQVRVIQMLS